VWNVKAIDDKKLGCVCFSFKKNRFCVKRI